MTTLATAPAPRKSSRLAVSLVLTINQSEYAVEPLDPGEDGVKAFRLVKHSYDEAIYDVVLGHDGAIRCDCGDYTMRREGLTSEPCKHGAALRQMGLLDAPKDLVNRNVITVDNSAPAKAPSTPAVAPEAPSRPFGHNIPTDGPSDRDRAASRAFGVRLPAKVATPAPSSPRDVADRIVAMLSCPTCEGEGCAACTDDAPAAETPAPTPCCPAGESRPCQPCQDAPGFADALTAAVGPLPIDEPIDLPGWLAGQVELYEALGSAASRFLAARIRRLADDISACMSPGVPLITVAEAEDRLAALAGA
jgi:hypothetical protein